MREDSAKVRVLRWMQNNPNATRHKLGTEIAKEVGATCNYGDGTLQLALGKLVKSGIVYRTRADRGYDYRINYWHKEIPKVILDNAPLELQKKMKEKLNKMGDNQYLDDEGCITTPNSVSITADPFNEDKTAPATESEDTTTQDVTIPLNIKKDGKQISVTLNLTINL